MWKSIFYVSFPIVIAYVIRKKVLPKKEIKTPSFTEDKIITNNETYISINGIQHRVVYLSHVMKENVPTIILIHGLGGQISQWTDLLKHFSNTANVLAIEHTGHGKSEQSLKYSAYKTDQFVDDLKELLSYYPNENYILVGHSYGCALTTLLTIKENNQSIKGIILISPKYGISKIEQYSKYFLKWIPDWLISISRSIDRKGGINSKSVNRFVHPTSSDELRYKQLCWNSQFTIQSFKRTLVGIRFPTPEEYGKVEVPVLLIGGKDDHVTPITNITLVKNSLTKSKYLAEPCIISNSGHQSMIEKSNLVSAIIQEFIIKKVGLSDMDAKVQILKTYDMDKWSLKNYDKWKKKDCISDIIKPSKFRGMKVMRQTDEEHCPKVFSQKYPNIGMVIDLTRDTPPYDHSDLESRNIKYKKIATVSKVPPPMKIVQTFIKVANDFWKENSDKEIAVHCHYGTNRTGFLIASYLIETYNIPVQEAINIFAKARPKGIRHIHFVDELYLRYSEYEKA